MPTLGIAIIGSGQIALANHLPGISLCPEARITALCDTSDQTLARASQLTGVTSLYLDHRELLKRDDVQAVVVATPNYTHHQIVMDAIAAGKHVLCEKPLAMNYAQALEMARAADKANVRHMTAFTYRFIPAVRYIRHLVEVGAVGRPYHFRANRFQDWQDRNLGWRQVKDLAGSGELGDMLSHRIDYAHYLVGPIASLVARLEQFIPTRGGKPSELDDWVAILAKFSNQATGLLESTKLATGRGEGARSQDYLEINGEAGTVIFHNSTPWQIQVGSRGSSELRLMSVPMDYLKWPGSPRDPFAGDPQITFRYDQDVEFIRAIQQNRPCTPSFHDGARTQAVMDTAILSSQSQKWENVPDAQ